MKILYGVRIKMFFFCYDKITRLHCFIVNVLLIALQKKINNVPHCLITFIKMCHCHSINFSSLYIFVAVSCNIQLNMGKALHRKRVIRLNWLKEKNNEFGSRLYKHGFCLHFLVLLLKFCALSICNARCNCYHCYVPSSFSRLFLSAQLFHIKTKREKQK